MGTDALTASASGVMTVPAAALPDLIKAHDRAVIGVQKVLANLNQAGRVPEPWTHDPVAQDIADRFNSYAITGDGSAYSYLCQYLTEVQRVADTLRSMHAAYQAGEDVNAAAMGAL